MWLNSTPSAHGLQDVFHLLDENQVGRSSCNSQPTWSTLEMIDMRGNHVNTIASEMTANKVNDALFI